MCRLINDSRIVDNGRRLPRGTFSLAEIEGSPELQSAASAVLAGFGRACVELREAA